MPPAGSLGPRPALSPFPTPLRSPRPLCPPTSSPPVSAALERSKSGRINRHRERRTSGSLCVIPASTATGVRQIESAMENRDILLIIRALRMEVARQNPFARHRSGSSLRLDVPARPRRKFHRSGVNERRGLNCPKECLFSPRLASCCATLGLHIWKRRRLTRSSCPLPRSCHPASSSCGACRGFDPCAAAARFADPPASLSL